MLATRLRQACTPHLLVVGNVIHTADMTQAWGQCQTLVMGSGCRGSTVLLWMFGGLSLSTLQQESRWILYCNRGIRGWLQPNQTALA
jgi:hypothetical protein